MKSFKMHIRVCLRISANQDEKSAGLASYLIIKFLIFFLLSFVNLVVNSKVR